MQGRLHNAGVNGMRCIGSSFNEDMPLSDLRTEDQAANLHRVGAMLPGFASGFPPEKLGGRVAFRGMSFDRLQILGALDERTSQDGRTALGCTHAWRWDREE